MPPKQNNRRGNVQSAVDDSRQGTFGRAGDPIAERRNLVQDIPVVTHWKKATKLIEINDILHRWRFNVPADGAVQTLANDATPSVEGGGMFQTGGTTAITDFDDGVVGDILYIEAKHSVTITHGTPIQLNGDANYDMVDGDTLVLAMWEDQVWHEVARGGQDAAAGAGAQTATIVIGPSSNSDSSSYDYVTDGTDDDVQIQAAIDVNTSSPKKIILREGTYTIGTTVNFGGSTDDITIEGMGRSTVIQPKNTFNDAMFANDTSGTIDSLTFKNIRFSGNSANQSNSSAVALNFSNQFGEVIPFLLVFNCYFDDWYGHCMFLGDGEMSIVRDCHFTTWAQTNTDRLATDARLVTGCYFEVQSGDTTARGASADMVTNNYVVVLNTWNGSAGFFVTPTDGEILGNHLSFDGLGSAAVVISTGIRSRVTNNFIDGGTSNADAIGIQVDTDNCTVAGNVIQETGDAIFVTGDMCVVSGNTIFGSEGRGIVVAANTVVTGNSIELVTEHGTQVTGSDCVISANRILNSGKGTDNTYDGILVDGAVDRCVITGNRVSSTTATDNRYGINVSASTCDNNIVSNNIVTDAQTGQINDAGTGTVTDGSNVTS